MKGLRHQPRILVALLLLIVMPAVIRASQNNPGSVVVLEGHLLTGYKSLCDLEPKRSPETTTVHPGAGWSFSGGCGDLDKQRLLPLTITFRNNDGAKSTRFSVPLLSEVTVRTEQGSEPAAALYIPWGSPRGFSTAVHGNLEIELGSGADIELLYLLPSSTGKPTISVKGYSTLKLADQ